jgi:hypothetical protein
MPLICYVERRFSKEAMAMVEKANAIIAEYEGQGFELTLRQLYYQFVARDLIPNTERSYKNLGTIVNNARLAGLIDWDHITDRTRSLRGLSHWDNPADIVKGAAQSYRIDLWANQMYRPEVWVEKDAMLGVIEDVCRQWDVPYFSCRGYTSQSEMWGAAMRLKNWISGNNPHSESNDEGQIPIVFHFGDHDPSGKDMTRDIIARFQMFMGGIELKRMALNMDQIQKYKPPPNPAKITDSRAKAYIAEFGDKSWELDALEPKVIVSLIEGAIKKLIDFDLWNEDQAAMAKDRDLLGKTAARWDKVSKFVGKLKAKKGKDDGKSGG